MKGHFTLIILFFMGSLLTAQESLEINMPEVKKNNPSEKIIYYSLSGNIVPIKIQQYGERTDLVFINLHDNETTSVDATKIILEQTGGMLIEIENNLERNISFRLGNDFYRIDPNRIFSREGIEKSLKQLGRSSSRAIDEVEKFGQLILQLIPEQSACIIALHNNTPDLFSVTEYLPGNERAKDCMKIYISPEQDVDDFFLTTDIKLYEQLAGIDYNTLLQDNKNCTEDGSLSVYCGKKNIRYVNCETEHGKKEQYSKMMKNLLETLNSIPQQSKRDDVH